MKFPLPVLFLLSFTCMVVNSSAAVLLTDSFTYTDGALTTGSAGKWSTHSGTSNELSIVSERVQLSGAQTEDVNALLSGQPYSGGTHVLYTSFIVRFSSTPNAGGSYFAHFKDGGLNFRARVWAITNSAAPGAFRLGISSTGATISATNATDLALNTDYRVVTRLVLSNSVATLWIDPDTELSNGVSTTESAGSATVTSYALRQATGIGAMLLDDLYVGTSFAEVTPPMAPSIRTQPASATAFAGDNVSFSVQAKGTPPLTYQWQFNGADLAHATNATLNLTNVSEANDGLYLVIVSNAVGSATSEPAVLTVSATAPGASAFSIVHYNVKGNFAADWSTNASQVQAIARQLLYLSPDIVAFNEIPNSLRHEMTNWMTAFFPGYQLAISSGTDGAIRSAVISRFSITRSNSWLDGMSLTNFGYNGTFTRDLFEAEIAVPGFAQPLHVFTTHLKSGQTTDESSRRAAESRAISNYFANGFLTTNASHPYLLTGDMNEDIARPPSSNPKTIQTLISTPVGLRLTTPLNPYSTNELTHSIQNTNGLSKRYDYILPCGTLFSNIAASEVFRTDLLPSPPSPLQATDSATASDHLPVMMVFNNPFVIAPTISAHPQPLTTDTGSNALFSVTAQGTEPFTYQWRFNGTNLADGARISGATERFLSIIDLSTNDSGNYSVVVSNSAGGATSSAALLTVIPPPVPPSDLSHSHTPSVPLGSNALFSVTANGTAPLCYQWLFKGTPIAGATNNSYLLTNAQNTQAGNYSVIVSNSVGSITSGNMALTVTWSGNPYLAAAGSYNGLFYEESGITHQSSGFLTLTLRTNAIFSGKFQLDGDTWTVSGKFPPNGMTNRPVSRIKRGKSDLVVTLNLELGNRLLRGSIASPGWDAPLLADKVFYNLTNLATNYSGRFTMVIPGSTNAAVAPPGFGYATINLSTNGKVTLLGSVADKAKVQRTVPISKEGNWPLYVPLYPGKSVVTNLSGTLVTNADVKGSIIGWATFTPKPAPQLLGTLSWTKTKWTNAFYPSGFTNEFDIVSSPYLPPAKGNRAVAITNGTITLAGGNLESNIVRSWFLNTNNISTFSPTNNRVRMTVTPLNGSISGTFIRDGTNRTTSFFGVILQQQRFAAGYFLGTNASGSAVLLPQE